MSSIDANSNTDASAVSVVIPAYNVAAYIGRAVASALAQTARPLEVIVVDDGSADGTGEIAAAMGPLVRVVRQENAGLPAARNAGIRHARGEFIALLDGDDQWRPGHLEAAMRVFAQRPSLQWYCAGYQRRTDRRVIFTRRVPPEALAGRPYVDDFFAAQARWTFCNSDTVVIRRRVFDEVGMFDPAMRFAEDMDMWFRIALRHPQVGYGPQVAAIWWVREGSLSAVNPKTPRVLLDFARRYGQVACDFGPAAPARCRPLIARWLRTALIVALKNGQWDVIQSLGRDYPQWFPLPLQWLCRLLPRPLVQLAGTAKARLKKLRQL